MTGEIGELVASKVLPFPVVKRPVPVALLPAAAMQDTEPWPTPEPPGHKLVVVDALGIRAVLTGPMGARKLEIFESGVLFACVEDDDKAMGLAEMVMAYEPEKRALIFVGVMICNTVPMPPQGPPEPPEPAP